MRNFKKVLSVLLIGGLLVFAFAGCQNKSGKNQSEGQDSTKALSGTVATNGSTSMEKVINSLSEQFMKDNKDVTVTYDPTGSGTGIETVSNGKMRYRLGFQKFKRQRKRLKINNFSFRRNCNYS